MNEAKRRTMKIEIKNRYSGEVLFSYECDNNTLRKTIIQAIQSNADLRNADLRNADLSDANLSDANLSDANLSDANLRNADLSDANLSDANLRNANLWNADLSDANLWNANLSDANLWNANLRNADLSDAQNPSNAKCVPMYCKWSHGITNNNLIHIGCEKRTIEEWDIFFSSDEEFTTKRDTKEFRQIQAVYEGYKAYLTFLGGMHFSEKTEGLEPKDFINAAESGVYNPK